MLSLHYVSGLERQVLRLREQIQVLKDLKSTSTARSSQKRGPTAAVTCEGAGGPGDRDHQQERGRGFRKERIKMWRLCPEVRHSDR